MRPRVLVDSDGVLSNFALAAVGVVNRLLGTSRLESEIRQFDFCRSLDLTPEESRLVKGYIKAGEDPGFITGMEPYPEAVEAIARLDQLADVYVVTSPWTGHPTWSNDRERWLSRHFGVPPTRVIHTLAKYVVAGDVFVDDKVDHVLAWRASHPRGTPIHWLTSHNTDERWTGLSTRRWSQVIEIVERLT